MQSDWKRSLDPKFSCKQPILVEGLPGIGNVGKIVVDYCVEKLGAKRVGGFFSYDLPNSVFITEGNEVALPSIDVYHACIGKQDFLFVSGDAQPIREHASYTLTEELLTLAQSFGCKEVVALGGVGLPDIPKEPQVYITTNDATFAKTFSNVNADAYGVVGPIVGVSGLLLGLSKQFNVPAVALLGETFGHPMYIGLKEARVVLDILNTKYGFNIDTKDIDEEILRIETEQADGTTQTTLPKVGTQPDTNYIG